MQENIIKFYRQTSCFTDLGYYRDFAVSLTDDIQNLCLLQRHQIIHPVAIMRQRGVKDTFHGDMTKIPADRLLFENERYQTAVSILAELLRREAVYSTERKIENKLHLCCREQAILLAAILKAKGMAARVRSGFAGYISKDGVNHDHWITEYYDQEQERWVLTDADCCCEDVDFNIYDIPRERFIFGAQAYLGLREKRYREEEISYASVPPTLGMKAALRALFYDFHSLMNDEIFFWHVPAYLAQKDMGLSMEEYAQLDELAKLMFNPDENHEALRKVWEREDKYRIVSGGFN